MKKGTVINLIRNFFTEHRWKYFYDEEHTVFLSNIAMDGIIGNIRIGIFVHKHYYKVYAILPNKVDEEHIGGVAEYLHRANYGLNNGNFELDYHDGEVRYKTFVYFKGVKLSNDCITESIAIPPLMFDRYGKNIIKLMLGNGSPEELLKDAEETQDDE